MSFLISYFSIGVGFYLGSALARPKSFLDARPGDLVRGFILGVPFWPVGVIVMIFMILLED